MSRKGEHEARFPQQNSAASEQRFNPSGADLETTSTIIERKIAKKSNHLCPANASSREIDERRSAVVHAPAPAPERH
jgi:hypothetical protein